MRSGHASPPPIGPTSGPLVTRLGAALFLRRDFYQRAADDPNATGPAGAIVCLVALARESVVIYEISRVWRAWGLIVPIVVVLALIAWLLIAAVAWMLTRPLRSPPPFRRLLRCLGFAQTPTMLLATLASVSDARLYLVAYAALMLWALAGVTVALHVAANITRGRAALLAVPVFLVEFVLLAVSRYAMLG